MPKPSKNWFTVLMAPRGGHLEAAWTLLASGTAPALDATAHQDGIPALGLLERGRRREQFWQSTFDDREYGYWRDWSNGFDPLPLDLEGPAPTIPVIPGPGGDYEEGSSKTWGTRLEIREALFARLVAMGANPWEAWTTEKGVTVDGFDLACAWGCTPLADLCLRHPKRPDMNALHARKGWIVREPVSWKNEKDKPYFTPHDGLLTVVATTQHPSLAKLLLDHGWDANGLVGGRAPLSVAKHPDTASALLAAGATWDPKYLDVWERLSKKCHGFKSSMAERVMRVGQQEQGNQDCLSQAMAKELLAAFLRNDNRTATNTLQAATQQKKGQFEKMEGWILLDGALGKTSLILQAAMAAFGRVSRNQSIQCRGLVAKLHEHAPAHDLHGATALGIGKLLTLHANSQPQGRKGHVIHTAISDGYDALDGPGKVALLLGAYQAVAQHGSPTLAKNAGAALSLGLDRIMENAECDWTPLAEHRQVIERVGLRDNTGSALASWAKRQDVATHLAWGTAMVKAGQQSDVGELIDRVEHTPDWSNDGQALENARVLIAVLAKGKEHGWSYQEGARLRRAVLGAETQPGADDAKPKPKM